MLKTCILFRVASLSNKLAQRHEVILFVVNIQIGLANYELSFGVYDTVD